MKKAKFGSVPPKTQKLPDGRFRVYLNVEKDTERNVIHRDDSDVEDVEEYDVYLCDEFDMDKEPSYETLIEALIRQKYSVSDELAIMRQRDEKPEEFSVYNAFAEECKALAKTIFND
ncbi:MAG: hypothetical protein IKY66_03500 [Bacteroidales bacterium]|nr:hypothetical protein [Bacteroidales bacterium]